MAHRQRELLPIAARRRVSRGVTLVELVAVLVVIGIVVAFSMYAIQGTISSTNLTASADLLVSEIDLAREAAGARNLAVDLRIYQDPAQKDSSGNPVYRLMALVIPASASGAASDEYLGAPVSLQGDVIVSSNPAYSSLLNPAASATLAPVAGTTTAPAPAFLLQAQKYTAFTFLPAGSLNLDGSVTWSLTLLNLNGKKGTTGPAANYVTLLLDVSTGRARIYQP